MDKNELRSEAQRLSLCRSMQDINDLLDLFLKFMFDTIENHNEEAVSSYADRDAKMVMQMMFSKVAHIKKVIEGIEYKSGKGFSLNNITDPTTIGVLIRNVYETVAMFNLIYKQTKTEEEKTIIYNLWAHAGLKFRQRFEEIITSVENKEKAEAERNEMQHLVDQIENTERYKLLSAKNQNKIQTKLKEKDYKICFENDDVRFLTWQEIIDVMGIRNGLLNYIYIYFSLYAHPSNVAVFQFAEMFKKDNESFHDLTNFNLKNMIVLLSIFIADFINLFPPVLETYNKQSILAQVVLNFHNKVFRGEEFSINDAVKELE